MYGYLIIIILYLALSVPQYLFCLYPNGYENGIPSQWRNFLVKLDSRTKTKIQNQKITTFFLVVVPMYKK